MPYVGHLEKKIWTLMTTLRKTPGFITTISGRLKEVRVTYQIKESQGDFSWYLSLIHISEPTRPY